jgi:hypothetical protein
MQEALAEAIATRTGTDQDPGRMPRDDPGKRFADSGPLPLVVPVLAVQLAD